MLSPAQREPVTVGAESLASFLEGTNLSAALGCCLSFDGGKAPGLGAIEWGSDPRLSGDGLGDTVEANAIALSMVQLSHREDTNKDVDWREAARRWVSRKKS